MMTDAGCKLSLYPGSVRASKQMVQLALTGKSSCIDDVSVALGISRWSVYIWHVVFTRYAITLPRASAFDSGCNSNMSV